MDDNLKVDGEYAYVWPWDYEDTRNHGSSEWPPMPSMYTIPFGSTPIGQFIIGPAYKVKMPKWSVDNEE